MSKEIKRKATKDDKPAKKSKPEKPAGKSKSESSAKQSKSKKADSTLKTGTYLGTNGTYVYDGTVLFEDEKVGQRDGYAEAIPKKNSDGVLLFSDAKEFRPNMTPKEVLQAGSFGGTYFRPIKSSVTGLKYNKMWNELPQNWLEGKLLVYLLLKQMYCVLILRTSFFSITLTRKLSIPSQSYNSDIFFFPSFYSKIEFYLIFTNSLIPSITNVIIVLDDSIANHFQCRGHEIGNIFSTFYNLVFSEPISRISTKVFSLEIRRNCLNNTITLVEITKISDTTATTPAVPFLSCLPEIFKTTFNLKKLTYMKIICSNY